MISVFLGFVIGEDPRIKMFDLGLATAILVDATIVRMILVPATMKLLGDANWWIIDTLASAAIVESQLPSRRCSSRRGAALPGRA